MIGRVRFQTVAVLAAGALLGYLAANADSLSRTIASGTKVAAPATDSAAATPSMNSPVPALSCKGSCKAAGGSGCCSGSQRGELLLAHDPVAARDVLALAAAQPGDGGSGKKPNILVIWGDDIGISNISAYSDGLMGYVTPNIDRIAKEGVRFLHYYGEQSCTAGRAAFLTGQHGIRTGLTKVGFPSAPMGMSQLDPSVGGLLKNLGYANSAKSASRRSRTPALSPGSGWKPSTTKRPPPPSTT